MSDDTTSDDDRTAIASLSTLHRLPKTTAVAAFEKRLLAKGLPDVMATTLARAVVDPADARARLDRLTEIRVPGGVIHALDTTVWATAAVPYVANDREASARHFPAGGKLGEAEASRYAPVRPPRDVADPSARLLVDAVEPQHLLWSLECSARYLLEHNPMTDTIGAQGVMQHVTLSAVVVEFGDGAPPVTMLGSVDGSSRVNGAHSLLGLTPSDVLFRFPRDERVHRQFIATLLDKLDRPADEVAAGELERLRALEIPARVFVDFTPDPVAPISYAKAVDSFVHLVHVEPPRAWDEAASLDAKADSVLSELLERGQITPRRKTYCEGMLSPDEARAYDLPEQLDERALELVALISDPAPAVHAAVRAGIVLLTKQNQVRKERKAEVAVELALRGLRSQLKRADAQGARETLQNAFLHDEIWARGIRATGQTPTELRDAALGELDAGSVGEACARLAAQGAFWLATQRVLREARFFASEPVRDSRTPQRVLTELMSTRWGVEVLYRAIVDGRDEVPIAQVDAHGTRQKNAAGELMRADLRWLRYTVVSPASAGGSADVSAPAASPLPARMLLNRLRELKKAVERVEDAHDLLRDVKDVGGRALVDEDGIAEETAEELRDRLERLRTRLAVYGETWKSRNAAEQPSPGVGADEDDVSAEAS